MKIYHYASIRKWSGIKEGSWESDNTPGLGANRRICANNPEDAGASDNAVFGLLEPAPASWTKNKEYPVAWNFLMANVGRLLLTIEPTDELITKSFILDWAPREHVHGGHKDDLSKKSGELSTSGRRSAERAYWASRIPLADYIENPEAVAGIALPEVVIMSDVPFSAISITETQPRLHDMTPLARKDLVEAINYDPELDILSEYLT